MTNTRKIALLLIAGGWIITITILFILDDFVLNKDVPDHLYIFLFVSIFILYWLVKSIKYYHKRIHHLHTEIENVQHDIREVNENIQLHLKNITSKNISQETEVFHLFLSFRKHNPEFIQTLREMIPGITEGEEKLCILIRLNKKNKEIAQILQIDEKSIYTTRSRFKRKLSLGERETIDNWIRNVGITASRQPAKAASEPEIPAEASGDTAKTSAMPSTPCETMSKASVIAPETSERVSEASVIPPEASERMSKTSVIPRQVYGNIPDIQTKSSYFTNI